MRPFRALVVWSSLTLGCGADEPTALVVSVSTQLRAPKQVRALRLVAKVDGQGSVCRTYAARRDADPWIVELPGAGGARVELTAAAFAADPPSNGCDLSGASIVRKKTADFVSRERLFVSLPLRQSCADVSCPEDKTCAGGQCVSVADRGPRVRFDNNLVSGKAGFCFSRLRCFEDVVPALLIAPDTCTFQFPKEVSLDTRLNVEVLYDDLAREILDLDDVEGFRRVPGKPDQFALAGGLCEQYRARKIAALDVGANCQPKDPLRPLCSEDDSDAGARDQSRCTARASLEPREAAVYGLFDQTRSGAESLEPLRDAVDRALASPWFRRTRFAFRALPARREQCGANGNPYGTATFLSAEETRGTLDSVFRASTPSDEPNFVDAALGAGGVYDALAARPEPTRMAWLISNRDVSARCPGATPSTQDLAYRAQARGARTSVLITKAAPGTDTFGKDPVVEGLHISRVGEGPFFDASGDIPSVKTGVAQWVADIAACSYDLPADPAFASEPQVELSYFDLLRSARVDIPRNIDCRRKNDVDGWNIDEGAVRICGKPCRDLRILIGQALVYAVENPDRTIALPDIPMKWSRPCE